MDGANIERISKGLADETRLLIFEAIADNKEINCSKIATLRRVTPATVSHHLRILSHAGLIECRRQGQFVHNRAVPEMIENYARELSRLSRPKKQSRRRRRVNAQPQPKRPEYASGSLRVSLNCVFDASLVPGTCPGRLIDLKGFIQQVPGESASPQEIEH
jgi:ArsR family transcriptional regulator, arsenate/arsenite/antimonite-responsive transcriptional repressor